MSLEAILRAISASGELQVRQIEARTQAQVDEILAKARQEAEQLRQTAYHQEASPAVRERARILHQARLQALQMTGGLRESLVEEALQRARQQLAELRTQDCYARVYASLLQEALTELGETGGQALAPYLEVDPRDRWLVDSLLSEMGLNLDMRENLQCWGGLVARSADERVAVINTLEARLARATPYLRRALAALFEEAECQTLTTAMPVSAP